VTHKCNLKILVAVFKKYKETGEINFLKNISFNQGVYVIQHVNNIKIINEMFSILPLSAKSSKFSVYLAHCNLE